jgi:hypothetical protein
MSTNLKEIIGEMTGKTVKSGTDDRLGLLCGHNFTTPWSTVHDTGKHGDLTVDASCVTSIFVVLLEYRLRVHS